MQQTLTNAISIFFQVIYILIMVRIVLSWFRVGGSIGNMIYELTEPVLGPARSMVDKSPIGGGMVDFSPVIALFILNIIETLLTGIIMVIFA